MAERGKGFPRLSLAGAVKVIETASKFGKSWPKGQFAGFGSQSGAGSAKSGAFAARIASLKDYGLITASKDTIALTDLSVQIVKPVTDGERKKAITQAFTNVEVFRLLFDSLELGEELSLDQVAQYAVFNLGISRESKDKFLSVFIDSGRFVNLVTHNKERSTITLSSTDIGTKSDESLTQQDSASTSKSEQSTELNSHSVITLPDRQDALSSNSPGTSFTEQGVNYSGSGWALTVLLKTSTRLNADTRKKVSELLEAAGKLSDDLHNLEEGNE